jgi:membrane protein DedA with SNARE-associated domain
VCGSLRMRPRRAEPSDLRWNAVLLASITNSFVQLATNLIDSLGLVGIFALMLAESACIPIPSEATMLFAGFGVSEGHFSLVAITIAGVAGNLVGSWLAYGVGYYGRMELVERHAHRLHVKPSHVAWADRWFSRYGEATVFFTRVLPIIRTFISLPAGVARMPFVRFTVFTLLGCIPWVLFLAFVGDQVGRNWVQWKDALGYVDYGVLAAVVGGVGYLVVRRVRARRPGKGSGSRGEDRDLATPEQHGADAEREPCLGGDVGDPAVAFPAAVAGVGGKDRGDAAEVPGEPEEQRDHGERDTEHSEHIGESRAAPVDDRDRDLDGGQDHSFGGSRQRIG